MARNISVGIDWQGRLDYEALVRRAEIADNVGVHSLWVPEAWGRDAFTLLAVLAARTRRIALGTAIVNIFSRSPAALAQHFATLDELSGGRMIIGLGTSGPQVIEHFHGVAFERPLVRLREYVEIINALLRGEPLRHEGALFRLERGFTLRFSPLRNHIPVYLATLRTKSVRLTAEIADGWLPILIPLPRLQAEILAMRRMSASAGRPPDAVRVRAPGAVVVTEDPAAARAETARTLAFYIGRMGTFYAEQLTRQGYGEAVRKAKAGWEGGSRAAAQAVPDDLVAAVSCAGPPAQCIERLHAQEESGVDIHTVHVQAESLRAYESALAAMVG